MPTHFHGILTKSLPSRVVSEKCEPVSVFLTAANLGHAQLQQLLDIAERKRKSNAHHDRQADDLGAVVKVLEGVCFRHQERLRNRPARLKQICSDKADETYPSSVAASNARPMRSTVASSPCWPIIWHPIGSPPMSPIGTASDGWPVTLNGIVRIAVQTALPWAKALNGGAGARVLSQILLEFECGHRPDIIMLRAPQTAETR
jgi:hypothetical protein